MCILISWKIQRFPADEIRWRKDWLEVVHLVSPYLLFPEIYQILFCTFLNLINFASQIILFNYENVVPAYILGREGGMPEQFKQNCLKLFGNFSKLWPDFHSFRKKLFWSDFLVPLPLLNRNWPVIINNIFDCPLFSSNQEHPHPAQA